jgi:hypothetical protein
MFAHDKREQPRPFLAAWLARMRAECDEIADDDQGCGGAPPPQARGVAS